ncbi:beta-glucosidase [Umbelopsis sp. PMI_123]|nr:beta-glucosidase [Umbelopsis sp. PMI_123]
MEGFENCLDKDFHFGFATAAVQIEGACNADGKGVSIWDKFSHLPNKIKDDTNVDDTAKAYEFYKEDVQLLKSYGANAYRFSISWSRIIPLGGRNDPVNARGIEFYSNLIDELLANGITPFVTLFHWDTPQALEDRYQSFLNKEEFVADFCNYARVCYEAFGDRVKHWITFNEPEVFSACGYLAGIFAPGRCSDRSKSTEGNSSTEPLIVSHNLLIAHGNAVKIYREEFQPTQKGTIGITLSGNWAEPWNPNDPRDVSAAERMLVFDIARFADPVFKSGDYPPEVRNQMGDRLPKFTAEESAIVLGSSDFYGMNTYTAFYIKHKDTLADDTDTKGNVIFEETNWEGKPRGPKSDTDWLCSTPWGFRKLLNWIYSRYNYPIYLTEQGTTAPGENAPTEDVLNDTFRIDYYTSYVESLARAVKEDGVVVKSYLAWSLLDNWEWANGFTDRFGVTFVDFSSPEKTRYPKKSAYVLRDLFQRLINNE